MAHVRTIFFGPFVHCKTLQEVDICEHGAIGVDETGIIAFIEREVQELDPVVKKHGWEDCRVVRIYDSGFFFPGFIGTYLICPIAEGFIRPFTPKISGG